MDALPGELTLDVFATELADAICDAAEACCAPEADCRGATAARIREAKTADIAYNPRAAAECVAAYRAAPKCTDRRTASTVVSAACRPVLDGTKKPGEPCAGPAFCERGTASFAACASNTTASMERVCIVFRPTAAVGEPCNEIPIGEGYERALCSEPGVVCSANVCVKQPRLGEPCPAGQCFESVCSSGTCAALPKPGEPCPGGRCVAGAVCADGTCKADVSIIPFACIGMSCPSDMSCGGG